jgi:two-component sensor histidine kinase/CHASE2 domain-containing sensor protein
MTGLKPPVEVVTDLDVQARRRVRIVGALAGLLGALLLAMWEPAPGQALFDAFQALSPAPDVSRQVHVVVVDADSLRALGGWPWSRFYLARLVERISEKGASAIAFDMLLPEPDRLDPALFASLYGDLPPAVAADIRKLPSMDAVFARAIGRGPVVLARAGVRRGSFDFPETPAPTLPPEARFAGVPPHRMLAFPAVIASLPILDGAAAGHGLVNGDRDADGVVRRVPLVAQAGGQLTPGFALEAVRVAEGAPQIGLIGSGGRLSAVQVGRRRVPATADGQLEMRFGNWRKTRTTSAADVLRRGLPDDLFKGQIVLIGVTSAGAADIANTPSARAVDSVYVQAQAVDSILRGIGLARPAWATWAAWGLGLLVALGAWISVPRRSLAVLTAIGAIEAAIALGGSWLAFRQDLLVDPLPILVPAAITAAAMIAALLVEGRRARAYLRAVLEDQRGRAEQRQQLLVNELNHRVKNTLATVQAIAMQTSRNTHEPRQFADAFAARLGALARAHDMLNEASWEGASLQDVIERALAPYLAQGQARPLILSGPAIHLGPNAAVTLNMAFHELATNASKYGSLSVEGGQVEVAWRTAALPTGGVTIEWREAGGPEVTTPVHRGFGSRLLEQALAREFGGQVDLMFAREGVLCRMKLPLGPKLREAA